MNEKQFEDLLHEDESSTLDFKREQYPFEQASDDVKSELLKDILAFANSWRRSAAYILMGVEEIKGNQSRATGVNFHLNDNDLQQFVNSKTQRPVDFSYKTLSYCGLQIGIIHVPVQQRPLFLKRAFGRLRPQIIYIRRGSSTSEANPDEVAQMGADMSLTAKIPQLRLELASHSERLLLGENTTIESAVFSVPPAESIPNYGNYRFASPLTSNRDYYRELAVHLRDFGYFEPLRFAVVNFGNTTALDVRVESHIAGHDLNVLDEYDFPKGPSHTPMLLPNISSLNRDVTVEEASDGWRVVAQFGKCQPKQTVFTGNNLYIGSRFPCEISISSNLFADDLSTPIESKLTIGIKVRAQKISLERLCVVETT